MSGQSRYRAEGPRPTCELGITAVPPTSLASLSPSQQARLTELLDEYLCKLEQGVRTDLAELTAAEPQLQPIIEKYVRKLNDLHDLVGTFPTPNKHRPSQRLGDFTLLREIGRGGMGTVYEAHQQSLDRRVAIKLLPMTAMLDPRQIARFKNESRAAGQLHHPNIVPIHSVGCENRIHFYAMQLIEGISIEAWIRQQKERCVPREGVSSSAADLHPWRSVLSWAIEIADALQCAHESGIVHRDVKPSNLMLDRNGKIWITDFGLARCQTDLALTQSGDVIGTMRYMSPEQAGRKSEMVDHRTDIYSLAATLFEMLTLQAAVEGEDTAAVLRRIAEDEPPRLRRFRSDLPPDLSVVLQKAMAKRKDDRYESASQFADDLRAVIAGRSTLARPPSLSTRTTGLIARHRKAVAASAGVLAVAILGLVIGSVVILRKNRLIVDHASRADIYFHQARATVDDLGTRFAAKLAEVPGAESVRRQLLQETLDYYQTFVVDASDDPRLQRKLALTHSRIGILAKELSSPAEAAREFRKAAELFDQIKDVGAQSARNLNHLALSLADCGQFGEAESTYRTALSRQAELLAQDPTDSHLATELALTKSNLGLLLGGLQRVDEATTLLQDARSRLTQLADRDASNLAAVRGLSATLVNLSSLSLDSHPQRSVPLLRQAIDQQLKMVGKNQNRLRYSAEVASLYNSLGVALSRTGQLSQAEQALSDAAGLQRQLVSTAPHVKAYQRDLALSLNNLGTLQQQRSDDAAAVASLREARELYRGTINQDLADTASLLQMAAMDYNLAVSLIRRGHGDQAELTLKESIANLRSAVDDAADPHKVQNQMSHCYSTLLRCQIRQGRWEHARITASNYQEELGDVANLRTRIAEDLTHYQNLADHPTRRRRSQP